MFSRYLITGVVLSFGAAVLLADSRERTAKNDLDGTWKLTRVVNAGREDPKVVGCKVEIGNGRIVGYDTEVKQTYPGLRTV